MKMMRKTKIFTPMLASIYVLSALSGMADDAKDAQKKESEMAELKQEPGLLAKGNTWVYEVTETVPKGLKVKLDIKVDAKETPRGTVYKYIEKQQSLGKVKLDEFKQEMNLVNIYFQGELKKQQVLKFSEGTLMYFGTYKYDKANPKSKRGVITIAPIILYSKKFPIAKNWSWTEAKLPLFEFRIMDKNVSIEVLGKTYKADKIRMRMVNSKTSDVYSSKEYWFVEGIGIVREKEKKFLEPGKAVVRVLELKSFERGKEPQKNKNLLKK